MTLISIKAFDSYNEIDDKSNSKSNSNININSIINNKTLFNIENNCVLIISDKYNIDSWKKNINLIFDNLVMEQDVYVINTIAHMNSLTFKENKINIGVSEFCQKACDRCGYTTGPLLHAARNGRLL